MNFIRENLLKVVIIIFVVIVLIIMIASCSAPRNVSVEEKYESMEHNMIEAAKKLTEKSKSFLPKEVGEEKSIKLSTLVSNELIDELHANEDSNVACSGYVLIEKKKEGFHAVPHLKCGKYYETKSIADFILDKEKIVTEDEGLYTNGAGFYTFKGEDPNNYVYLDEKYFRILSINDNNELKLIAAKSYDSSVVWDDRYNSSYDDYVGINNFEKSRLRETLEYIYDDEEYFSTKTKNLIVPHDICIGKRSESEKNNISGTIECSQTMKDQYFGLIQTNEYLNASTDPGCVSTENYECSNYNYLMNISSRMVTQTASKDDTYQVYYVTDGVLELTKAENDNSIYPVFYLDKNTLYKSGDGSVEKPYILK